MKNLDRRETRWNEERLYFDAQASKLEGGSLALCPAVVSRYASPGRLYSKEFRLGLLGDLAGKKILDAGCNDGENSVLLGRLGAEVLGVDISSGAIELAGRRAEINGLSATVRFLCAPLEVAVLQDEGVDIVWCHRILHHVIPDMRAVLDNLVRCAKPGAVIVISEPVNLLQLLRNLRAWMPFKLYGSPGERPLEQPELDLIFSYIEAVEIRRFGFLSRLGNRMGGGTPLERASLAVRWMVTGFAFLDYCLLSIPGLSRLAGEAVIWGRLRRP
jgi:2-polyprenyl-3-methyl-5-hydroxy-6-metoxy-1,4-benzoquinol methylase